MFDAPFEKPLVGYFLFCFGELPAFGRGWHPLTNASMISMPLKLAICPPFYFNKQQAKWGYWLICKLHKIAKTLLRKLIPTVHEVSTFRGFSFCMIISLTCLLAHFHILSMLSNDAFVGFILRDLRSLRCWLRSRTTRAMSSVGSQVPC